MALIHVCSVPIELHLHGERKHICKCHQEMKKEEAFHRHCDVSGFVSNAGVSWPMQQGPTDLATLVGDFLPVPTTGVQVGMLLPVDPDKPASCVAACG